MVDNDDEPVLVGLDGSESSIRAAFWAVGFAKTQGKRLICVYVHTPVPAFNASAAEGVRQSYQETADGLSVIVAEHCQDLGLDSLFIERWGGSYAELAKAAVEFRVVAVVVGASNSVAHRIRGSVGAQLARHSMCPVVIVP